MTINETIKKRLWSLSEYEYSNLEKSIIEEGCREPLILWNDILVDGHNRYDICVKHGISYTTINKEFANIDKVFEWVDTNQLSRRNLLDWQRTILEGRLSRSNKREIKEQPKSPLGHFVSTDKNQQSVATELGVSTKTLQRSEKFLEAYEDLERNVGQENAIKILSTQKKEDVVKLGKIEPIKQQEVIEKIIETGKSFKEVKNDIYKKNELEKKDTSNIRLLPNDIKLYNCDILDSEIPDDSIDIIITDPPYPRQFLDCWKKLAIFAYKKLKKDGIVIAISGQSYLPEVFKNMNIEGLNYYWTGAIYTPGTSPNLQNKRLNTNWKPFLFYVKGEYNKTFQKSDVYISNYSDTKNGQEFHKWGQSYPIFNQLVIDYSYSNDIICDPFLGGGTTGIACLNNKRKFIGIEIDTQVFDMAKKRIIDHDKEI